MGSEASEEVMEATKKTGNPETEVYSAIVDGNMGETIFDPTALPHVEETVVIDTPSVPETETVEEPPIADHPI